VKSQGRRKINEEYETYSERYRHSSHERLRGYGMERREKKRKRSPRW
jgi:hypothetical protein